MKIFIRVIAFWVFLVLINSQAQALSPVLELGDESVYASVVEKELLWSTDQSLTPDLQAVHSKSFSTWYFFDGKNRIDAKILGTPLKTDGSSIGFISAKSFAANGYVASCVDDPMGSSGAAGNFISSYLILNAHGVWRAFAFYTEDGCSSVNLRNPEKINLQYQSIDLKKPGRVITHHALLAYKDEQLIVTLSPKVTITVNPFVRRYFYFLKDSFIKQK